MDTPTRRSPPPGAARRRPVALALGLVVMAAHLGAWELLHAANSRGNGSPAPAVHVTVVSPPAMVPAPENRPAATLVTTPDGAVVRPVPAPSAVAGAVQPLVPSPSPGALSRERTDADADERYWPRRDLSRAPAALTSIELPYPDHLPAGRHEAELSLFIDADGTVRRVRLDSGDLPSALEAIARQAFLAARFSPGEREGQPVRSLLRVAVRFEADPPAQDRGTPVLAEPAAAAGR